MDFPSPAVFDSKKHLFFNDLTADRWSTPAVFVHNPAGSTNSAIFCCKQAKPAAKR